MQFSSIFRKKKQSNTRQKVNVFSLETGSTCYYNGYKTPFRVEEKGVTESGVPFVEIVSVNTAKKYLFTQKHLVEIELPID